MQLAPHHRWALAGAAATSAIALFDAATHGLTGRYSAFSEESDLQTLAAAGSLVHGLTYLALAVVLVREAGRFHSTNFLARGSRWLVLGSLAVLALGFTLVAPLLTLAVAEDGPVSDTFGLVAGPAFLGMVLGSLLLGLTVLRTRWLGTGGRVLAWMLPAFGMTLLLGWLAPEWAHPAYLETTLHLGLALVGVGAVAPQPATRVATASPISAV
jgi:hypothetical protein